MSPTLLRSKVLQQHRAREGADVCRCGGKMFLRRVFEYHSETNSSLTKVVDEYMCEKCLSFMVATWDEYAKPT